MNMCIYYEQNSRTEERVLSFKKKIDTISTLTQVWPKFFDSKIFPVNDVRL